MQDFFSILQRQSNQPICFIRHEQRNIQHIIVWGEFFQSSSFFIINRSIATLLTFLLEIMCCKITLLLYS